MNRIRLFSIVFILLQILATVLPADAETGSVGYFLFSKTLYKGSRGEEVRNLQIILNLDPITQIASEGPAAPGNETGTFGNLTKDAVKRFQKKYGLRVTGIVDKKTRSVLERIPVPPDRMSLKGSCRATPESAGVGQAVRWSSSPSGSKSSYRYSWAGTDNISGSTQSITKIYQSGGFKEAEVIITSGRERLVIPCDTTVLIAEAEHLTVPPPSATCSASPTQAAIGTPITWTVDASGWIGGYTYNWSGSDGLEGSATSIVKSYTTDGEKTARVTVTSGDREVIASCSASVTAPVAQCGNNIIESNETCECGLNGVCGDNDDAVGQNQCTTQGFQSGTLRCSSNCTAFDTSQCRAFTEKKTTAYSWSSVSSTDTNIVPFVWLRELTKQNNIDVLKLALNAKPPGHRVLLDFDVHRTINTQESDKCPD
ncbi:MAG: peptidoglycan-binding protein, partial [bacterium]|nr:peptidoglycan-binding protein [bacterium]